MKQLKTLIFLFLCFHGIFFTRAANRHTFPKISETPSLGYFPLSTTSGAATIYTDSNDYKVVSIAARMLADDVKRVTGKDMQQTFLKTGDRSGKSIKRGPAIVAGTLGHNPFIDKLVSDGVIHADSLKGKWESFIIATLTNTKRHSPLLVIVGSDRRGTAFGLTSLSEAIGVSPWYWWADVTPKKKNCLYVEPCAFRQKEPSVQYRGIFINDERFGGWARWAETKFENETGKVGPKTYQKVFELLLRLKANYLWPAMHPGTAAFNSNPENARLADDYAIVMGTSHCEQMLRNNEDEWKKVGIYGDFNYITNRPTMIKYWEDRIKTNGRYENTYTLGLRGIHDYPMEGAKTTQERVKLMQEAIDDQREILKRNINKPIEDIPQVLCPYEEVLDAYHNGLKVPDDVTLLWSDDKQGYCRNLCNPEEQKRKGGSGIYYHLSYHGDPASWIWLSPLSPSFISTELTKAYEYGARKIWVFNVGDIKPAEKEISFVMDLAWGINRWKPENAHNYIKYWAAKTFNDDISSDIADIQAEYYRLQASGKDAHVYFVQYSEEQIKQRIADWNRIADKAVALSSRVPATLKDAYFELVSYPVRGAAMLNEYSLLARRSMVRASRNDSLGAMADADTVRLKFKQLNDWTNLYNNEIQGGKWSNFFNWQPMQWFRSTKIDPPISTPEIIDSVRHMPKPQSISVAKAESDKGVVIVSDKDGEIPIWMEALSFVRNFSKAHDDNIFCHVTTENDSFDAAATPINNVWHSPWIGPMWSKVGVLHLKKGKNRLRITNILPGAKIYQIYLGLWNPFHQEPRLRIPAANYISVHNANGGTIKTIKGLGFNDGVMVQPFTLPSDSNFTSSPYVEYQLDMQYGDSAIDILTLPTLHLYDGRNERYAVQLGDGQPQTFEIHAADFSAEWRRNVLRGYSRRRITIPSACRGKQRLRIYFIDPGIVLQEINIIQNNGNTAN